MSLSSFFSRIPFMIVLDSSSPKRLRSCLENTAPGPVMFLLVSLVVFSCSAYGMGDRTDRQKKLVEDAGAATLFSKAEFAVAKGDSLRALELFMKVGSEYPGTTRAPDAWMRAAEIAYRRRNFPQAIRCSENCISYENDRLLQACLRIKVRSLREREESGIALDFLAELLDRSPTPATARLLRGEIEEILEAVPAGEILRILEGVDDESAFYPVAYFFLGRANYHSGSYPEAREIFEDYLEKFGDSTYAPRAMEFLGRLGPVERREGDYGGDEHRVDRYRIGLLSPMSDRYAILGVEIRNAVQMAIDLWNHKHPDFPGFTCSVIDTRADPVSAILGVQDFIREERVIGIVGPILSLTTIGAAGVANAYEVPLITPTATDSRLSEIGPYVFQLNGPPEFQIPPLIDYLDENYLFQRYAILFPRNSYGEKLAREFSIVSQERGKDVVAEVGYESGKADFKDEILNLREIAPDVIYVPAGSEDLEKLSPQLAFYEVQAQILGGNGWNSRDLFDSSGRYMEGVIFTDFYPMNPEDLPAYRDFQDRFVDKYHAKPGRAAQLSFDAMNFMLHSIESGVTTRRELKNQLQRSEGVTGVTGETTFLPNGLPDRECHIYTVAGGKICQLNR